MTDEIITLFTGHWNECAWSARHSEDNADTNHVGYGRTKDLALADLKRLDTERQEAEYVAYASERLGHDYY